MLLKIYEVVKRERKLRYVINSDNFNIANLDKALCSCVREENITRYFQYDKNKKGKTSEKD